MDKKKAELTSLDIQIAGFLKAVARRKTLQKWILCTAWCVLVSVVLALVLNIVAIFVPVYNAVLYGWLVILAGFIVSFIYVLVKRASMYEAARYADSAGLKERLVTSIGCQGSDDGFAGLLKEDTINEINHFDKKLRLPFKYPWKRYITSCLLLCLFIICIFIPSQAKKDARLLHKLAMQAEEAKEKMEEAEKLLDKAANNELAKKEAAKIKKILDEAKKEISNSESINDIKKAKERLESKLKQELAEAGEQGIIKAAQPLVPGTDLEGLADFNKKLAELAEKSGLKGDLSNELKSVAESLTAGQMKELLEQLEKAMGDGEITASEVADALFGLENSDAQIASATITASSQDAGGVQDSSASPSPSSTPGGAGQGNGNGNGSGSGQGNGNGNGSGSGSGTGKGNGGGKGSGTGGGWNMGDGKGLERKEQEGKGEIVNLTGKKTGNDDNLTGKKNGDARITEKSGQQGGASEGIKADLDSVIGEYSSEAYAKVNSNKVPSAMKDIVKEYFSGFGSE